jgi:hypothetical protein
MPTYLDAHDLGNVTEEQLKQTQNSPKDEFGVIHKNILYNKEENKAFCVLDAPNRSKDYFWIRPTIVRIELQIMP